MRSRTHGSEQKPPWSFKRFSDRVIKILENSSGSPRAFWLDLKVMQLELQMAMPKESDAPAIVETIREIDAEDYCIEEIETSVIRVENAAQRALRELGPPPSGD